MGNNKPKPNTITAPANKKKKEQIEEQNNKAHAEKQRQQQKLKSSSHAFHRAPFNTTKQIQKSHTPAKPSTKIKQNQSQFLLNKTVNTTNTNPQTHNTHTHVAAM
jgi:hypothetical protein